ncbi:helicase associated domain-containing protein [Prescottella agglutinans]|uniref:Helicase-associated domain-containing protein n=1 Tax=Prescottella agglutinans TaxID=1644129 RepID=A0ABT6ML66_9NOCA|nr:helicase associated domain-containing protein [Prescottella agglutinans]MDH6284609.1 hypothetical protein [Prescottella agglutinans]
MRNDERFAVGVAQLRAYVDEHGNGQVPRSFVSPDGFRLGRWVAIKRAAIRDGKKAMTPERIAELTAAGFVLDPERVFRGPTELHKQQWETGLAHLRAYIAAHGDADVPRRYVTPDGFQLGMWVQTRRKVYRAGRCASQARVDQLNEIGFVWTSGRRGGFGTHPAHPDSGTETPGTGARQSR